MLEERSHSSFQPSLVNAIALLLPFFNGDLGGATFLYRQLLKCATTEKDIPGNHLEALLLAPPQVQQETAGLG